MYLLLEETEKQAVRRALIEERGRFCTFITFLQPVVVGPAGQSGIQSSPQLNWLSGPLGVLPSPHLKNQDLGTAGHELFLVTWSQQAGPGPGLTPWPWGKATSQ